MQVNANEINPAVMGLVIETAVAALEASDSIYKEAWLRAVSKAADEFLANPYFSYEDGVLLFNSQTSQTLYEIKADGSHHGCTANDLQRPCYHRAMRRLLDLYKAAVAMPHVARPDLEPTPAMVKGSQPGYPDGALIAPSLLQKPELYGGIEI